MKKILPYLAFFLSIIFVTFLWNKINLPFNINTAILGDNYFEQQYHPQNDTIRFIIFLSVPLLVLIFLFQTFEKSFFKNLKSIITDYDFTFVNEDRKLKLFFLITIFFVISEFFLLNFGDFDFHIDIFHEGLWLTASQNAKITNEFWKSSYIARGFFGNFYPFLLWGLSDLESSGV